MNYGQINNQDIDIESLLNTVGSGVFLLLVGILVFIYNKQQ